MVHGLTYRPSFPPCALPPVLHLPQAVSCLKPFAGGLPTVCSLGLSPSLPLTSSQSTGSNGCLFEEVSWSHYTPDLGAPLASNIIQRVTIRRHINVVLATPTRVPSSPGSFTRSASAFQLTLLSMHLTPKIVHLARQSCSYTLHQGPSSQNGR